MALKVKNEMPNGNKISKPGTLIFKPNDCKQAVMDSARKLKYL